MNDSIGLFCGVALSIGLGPEIYGREAWKDPAHLQSWAFGLGIIMLCWLIGRAANR